LVAFALALGVAGAGPASIPHGARAAANDPAVRAFGDAPALDGPSTEVPLSTLASTPSGRGLVAATAEGDVFVAGDIAFAGSARDNHLNRPVVGVAATPSRGGYWLTATDGGVFSFGDATFLGSTGDVRLNEPIVGMAATRSGGGYWLVARDGGVFTFGDATFLGSTGDVRLNEPIVGMAATRSGGGYWLVARDGGVFTFGDAVFHGSAAGSLAPGVDAVGLAAGGDSGYWIGAGAGAIRISMAGDVHGEGRVRALLDRGQNPLSEVAGHLQESDLAAVNLETPVGRPGSPQQKEFVFLAPTTLLDALAAAGVDVVNLANNHALDHGRGTLLETVDNARRAGLVPVGAGRNAAEAYRPAIIPVRGRQVAFIGLSRVVPPGWAATASSPGVASAYDEHASLQAVRSAAAHADVVVVLVHWGVELATCPGSDIVAFARRLHAAGATVVAGHHPHVLQGIAADAGGVTAFSLGNFVWYHDEPPTDATGILDVEVTGADLRAEFQPARVGGDGRPRLLSEPEADAARRRVGPVCAAR
jgi:poly-gamma-glutamate capsule biosynthesis protein CapA/YwtB (metallophosphatase superfamily)